MSFVEINGRRLRLDQLDSSGALGLAAGGRRRSVPIIATCRDMPLAGRRPPLGPAPNQNRGWEFESRPQAPSRMPRRDCRFGSVTSIPQ